MQHAQVDGSERGLVGRSLLRAQYALVSLRGTMRHAASSERRSAYITGERQFSGRRCSAMTPSHVVLSDRADPPDLSPW
jgi:hypothetical protein